jgi:hypothetical protein
MLRESLDTPSVTPRVPDDAPGIHEEPRWQVKMLLTPAGELRTLTPSHDNLLGTRERRTGGTRGREGLAIVALRQRHRQSWGYLRPCTGLLISCPLPGSPSPVLAYLSAGAPRTHCG